MSDEKKVSISEGSQVKKDSLTNKFRENPWIASTLVLGIIVLFLAVGSYSGKLTGNVISANTAGDNLLKYYEANGADGLTVKDVKESNGLYQVIFEYQGSDVPIYMTKDGKLAGSMNPISDKTDSGVETQEEEIPKSNKPVVELFVMTHCPYGTQAEKGIIPTIKALGDSVDAKIRFVHYTMHGEKEDKETRAQVCIREEQSAKWYPYLECFLASTGSEADATKCLTTAGIDKAKLDTCIKTNAEKYYKADSDLSEGYGVQGSPTLIINGVQASSGRSPDAFLQSICTAFNTVPDKCTSLKLSVASPSPGFGTGTASAGASDASCG